MRVAVGVGSGGVCDGRLVVVAVTLATVGGGIVGPTTGWVCVMVPGVAIVGAATVRVAVVGAVTGFPVQALASSNMTATEAINGRCVWGMIFLFGEACV
jgi:hypothetical protein